MAEIAAVASGAGLASFGLQCCKGLAVYYSSYKAYDERIGATHEEIEILTNLLQNLENILSRNPVDPVQASSVKQVESILDPCRARLQKLQDVLDKCQSVASPNNKLVKLQRIKSKALFPFKEQTLLTLRENVHSLRGDLQLALQVFHADIELQQKQNIASLAVIARNVETASQNTHSDIHAIATPIHRMDSRFDLLLQKEEDIKTTLSKVEFETRQNHEITLDICRTISEQCHQILQHNRASPRSLQTDLCTSLVRYGLEQQLLRKDIQISSQKREREAEEMATKMNALERKIANIQLHAISRPSLLQSTADENNRLAVYVSQISDPSSSTEQADFPTRRRIRKRCNCNARYANSHGDRFPTSRCGQAFGHQGFFRSSVTSTGWHDRKCPIYPSSLNVATARFTIGICGALLNRAIEASISIIHGAGGYSISPKLHCSRLVSRRCKAFELVRLRRRDIPRMTTFGNWEAFLNGKIRKIERLFRAGLATPHDIDCYGNTLLHEVGGYLGRAWVSDIAHKTGLPNQAILNSLVTFCESLHNLGVPLNWISHSYGRKSQFIQPLIHDPPWKLEPKVLSRSLNRLCDIGLQITSSSLVTRNFIDLGMPYYQISPWIAFPECREVLDGLCTNEIHTAIVNRSASHLEAALQRSPDSINESNDAGHTPLHLAADWPHGLSLLLPRGADLERTDLSGRKAIQSAIILGCAETVRQLLRAGCSLDILSLHSNVFALAVKLLQSQAWRASSSTILPNYFEIVKIIIEELVSRGYAPVLEKDSSTLSVSQTKRYLLNTHTAYHCQHMTVELANELWSAGFQEIDTPDDFYMTPLMTIIRDIWDLDWANFNDTINYAFWLFQKGASLYRPQRRTLRSESSNGRSNVQLFGTLAIHFVAVVLQLPVAREAEAYWIACLEKGERARTLLGYSFPARLMPLIDDLSLDCQHFLYKIMFDASPDGCICACSRHGCLPVTLFLKRKDGWCYGGEKQKRYISEWKCLWFFDNVPTEKSPKSVIHAIVRSMTFEKLGLRHTCCRMDFLGRSFDTIDAEEAEEIRDEDREGIQLLESLLQRFEENYDDRDLKTWLEEYWDPEMEDVLAELDREAHDEAGLREAGVVLRENLGDSDEDLCYD